MNTILSTTNLSKSFGRVKAVDSINLSIEKGMIYGMLGPNGSGKTTTLGMLLGVTRPSEGSYSWFGRGRDYRVRKKIGSILEHPIFYPYMTGEENLRLASLIKEAPISKIDEVLAITGLLERKRDRFKTYSLGMKQRLAIASALLNDPDVLVLDEPTNGLDPQGLFDIRQLIQQIASSGKTIILASHLLDEVQKVCSHFCVLKNGKLIHQGNVEEDFGESTIIEVMSDDEFQLKSVLEKVKEVHSIRRQDNFLLATVDESMTSGHLNQILFNEEVVTTHLRTKRKSLEEQFLALLKEEK